MQERYKKIKQQLGVTYVDVAAMFGYSSVQSFRNAARKEHIVKGIVELFDLIHS